MEKCEGNSSAITGKSFTGIVQVLLQGRLWKQMADILYRKFDDFKKITFYGMYLQKKVLQYPFMLT